VNNDFGLANKADKSHLPTTLGTDERVCFVDLLDEVGPAFFHFLGYRWRGDFDELRFPNDVFLVFLLFSLSLETLL